MSKWVRVANDDELAPGERKLCTIADCRIALFRVDDAYWAIDNHCPHQGAPIGAGRLRDRVVQCPWHGRRFNVQTGQGLDAPGQCLRRYPTRVEDGQVMVDVQPPPDAAGPGAGSSLRYLVRYGAVGHVGRFETTQHFDCSRGHRVVVGTNRGVELGEMLGTPIGRSDGTKAAASGPLLRRTTDQDERIVREQASQTLNGLLDQCSALLEERSIRVQVVDAERLLDGKSIIIYYLGSPTSALGPVASTLAGSAGGAAVRFECVELDESAATEDIGRSGTPSGAPWLAPPGPQPPSMDPAPSAPAHGTRNEQIKWASRQLRGSIAQHLHEDAASFPRDDATLLEFHGVYQQTDRDTRDSSARPGGPGRRHMFMIRTKVAGGKLTAGQLLTHLELGDRFADATVRITSRQGLQLHGVIKRDLRNTLQTIDAALLTTMGACGDVVRNVMCCPAPRYDNRAHRRLQQMANDIARHLMPRTRAYHQIWVDDQPMESIDGSVSSEPLYDRTYLPHKCKIGIALPEDNCVDVYTQDVGLLGVVEGEQLLGFNLMVGGGLATTPAAQNSFARLADLMAFVPYGDVLRVVTAVAEVYRDFGNRQHRRQGRLKYLVAQWGASEFRAKVEQYLNGNRLADPRPVDVSHCQDHLGWHPQGDGNLYLGLHIPHGRILDTPSCRTKSLLRRLCERFRMPVRLTPQQNLLLCDLRPEWGDEIGHLLGEHDMPSPETLSPVRRGSMACPALPTCRLAITEAERVMGQVVDALEGELARLGLPREKITLRMTGCPNACARPYTADIGLVGQAAGRYTIFVGGGPLGKRLSFVYKEQVALGQIVEQLRPILLRYRAERHDDEPFGDFCCRLGPERLTATSR